LTLATSTEALMIALGIGRLWRDGYVETILPPPSPLHIFAQQVLALVLQESGIARGDWPWWLGDALTGADHTSEEEVIAHMLATGILVEDAGILGIGPEGEAKFGRRYFQELVAAFTTPLLLAVRYGGNDLGSIDPLSLESQRTSVPVILLGEHGDERLLISALHTNVAGVFTKDAALDEFLVGVQTVLSGHRAVGSNLMAVVLDRLGDTERGRRPAHRLSPTEVEILTLIGQAKSISVIASMRGISHKTVRNHLANIYRKMELRSRTEAMLCAARLGLTAN